jgi:hypothetical protein
MEVGGRPATISDATYHRIADAIGIRFDGRLHWDFLNSFKITQRACRKAQRKAIRMIADGWTGQGKTYGFEHYAVTSDYVVYVKCTNNMSAKGLLDAILHQLGVHDNIRGNYEKLLKIRAIVRGRRGWLIIIDECEVVKAGINGVLKDISDISQGYCALIVSGMGLTKKLDKYAESHKPGFPQLRRRFFGNQVEIPMLTPDEVIQVCEYEKITTRGAQNVLAKYVKDLDMLSQYVSDIKEWQEKQGKKISGEEVIQLLGIQL